jgi:hypothetical protein
VTSRVVKRFCDGSIDVSPGGFFGEEPSEIYKQQY